MGNDRVFIIDESESHPDPPRTCRSGSRRGQAVRVLVWTEKASPSRNGCVQFLAWEVDNIVCVCVYIYIYICNILLNVSLPFLVLWVITTTVLKQKTSGFTILTIIRHVQVGYKTLQFVMPTVISISELCISTAKCSLINAMKGWWRLQLSDLLLIDYSFQICC